MSQPPTARQLAYLRTLAHDTGTTFTTPRSRRQASREIDMLTALKRRNGRCAERPVSDEHPVAYATTPQTDEINGWGSTARWRSQAPRTSRRDPLEPGDARSPEADAAPGCAQARRLATYTQPGTRVARELVSIELEHAVLVVDRDSSTGDDARLVGTIDPDEPPGNDRLLADLYLEDPARGRCRRVTKDDLEPPPTTCSRTVEGRWQMPLPAGVGVILQIQPIGTDNCGSALRWTRTRPGSPSEPLSLRDVVGQLQDYQPALALTRSGIAAQESDGRFSTHQLRSELARVAGSPILLNRRLREQVAHAVDAQGVSMSEIAIRCGRIKRNARGRESGETSWLGRRIGLLAEAGAAGPTPWIHVDVLALIARDGLGIAPGEAEVPLGDC